MAETLCMIKFSHTIFALPFALMSAFWAAGGFFGMGKLILIIVCMVSGRSLAMTFNRLADHELDGRNPRTAQRSLPKGKLSRKWAWVFLVVCGAVFIFTTLLFNWPWAGWFGYGNPYPGWFSVPTLSFVMAYSYTKRFTWACHFWLGASLMLTPLGAWAAIAPPMKPLVALTPILLGMAVMVWTAGFDIIYALQDIYVDRQEGLFSLPARLGGAGAMWISRICHSFTVSLLLILGLVEKMGVIYYAAVILVALLLVIEHVIVLKPTLKRIQAAFGVVNGIISIVISGAAIIDIIL